MPQEVRFQPITRPLTFVANNRVSELMPRGSVYREIYLQLEGQLTIAVGANNTLAGIRPGDEWGVISRLEIIANSSDVIKSLSGEELWWLNHYLYGVQPPVTATLGDAITANPAFNSTLILPFWMPRSIKPIDSALDARELADLKLEITWADHLSIHDNATGFTVPPTVSMEALFGFGVEGPFGQWRIFRQTRNILATTTQEQIILPIGEMYRGFLIGAKDAGDDSALIVNNMKLLSGPTVFADVPADVMRQIFPARLGVESGVALRSPNSNRNAWLYYDHVTDGFNTEAIDTLGFSEFTMELDVTLGGGATQIIVVPQQIIPVRDEE